MSTTWILLRGLIREQRHWEAFPQQLAAAMPGARLLALDLPGNGRRNHERSPTRISGMVEAVRSELAARGEQGPWSVLALSLGAMTAFEWMSRYPHEVERAVLLNTSLAAFSPLPQRLRARLWPQVLGQLLLGSTASRERFILETTTNCVPDLAPVVARWTQYQQQCPVGTANALRQLLAAARYRRPALAPACPVLLLNGAGDRLVDPRCSAAIAGAFGLPLHRHPQAGHDLTLDAGDWVAAEVARFAGA